jgi:hypothetical protein
MRRILTALMETRKGQLSDHGASSQRLQECEDLFRAVNRELDGLTGVDSVLRETMVTGDFTYALLEYVSREFLGAYQEQTFAFEPLVFSDQLPNYLPVIRYLKQAGVDDLEYVGEKGQARPGYVVDATKRQWQVFPWKKQYDFSHQALKNDDMGYFNDQIALMGRAARRTLEKFVSRMYTNNVSTGVLTTAGVLYSTTGRLSTARISQARMAFNQRVNIRNERIQSPLQYIVYHTGLKDTVATIQQSTLVPETAVFAENVVRGTFTAIEDPYIAGAAPNLPWFAFTSPNQIKTLVLARLAGWPGPKILRKRSDIEAVTSIGGAGTAVDPLLGDFATGNITLQVWDVWGTYVGGAGHGNLIDHRGAYYSDGTAQ